MMTTAADLLRMNGAQLDELFETSAAGPLPTSRGAGTAVMAPGTIWARPLAGITRVVAWQGKEFGPDGSSLRNVLSPFGVRAVAARVQEDASWVDGQPCVVLDYSSTSKVARWVRDEIREVAPGLYLGVVFLRSRRLPVRFSLAFSSRADGAAAARHDSASGV